MVRIWILLTGILMLFPQVKAEEGPYVADLPVEPTPTVTMNKRQVPLLEILQELEKQTGIFFSYESSMLDEFHDKRIRARLRILRKSYQRFGIRTEYQERNDNK